MCVNVSIMSMIAFGMPLDCGRAEHKFMSIWVASHLKE